MASWFRWYHGCVSDPKLGVVAKNCKQPKYLVIAVWAALLEMASQASDRGDVSGFSADDFAEAIGADTEAVQVIFDAMLAKGLIEADRVAAWAKRQFEGADNTAASRQKRKRERDKSNVTASHGVTERDVTGVTASETDTDSDAEQNREGRESVAVAPPAPEELKPIPKPPLPAKQSSEPDFPDIPPALKREAKATRLPAGWQPSADLQAWAALDLPRLDWRRETENFRDYWLAAPGAKGLKLDWDATWRKWMRKSEESLPAARRFNDRQQSNDGGGVDWSRRVEDFRARNFWLTSWGAAPTDPGCQAPALILHQHGYRTEAA